MLGFRRRRPAINLCGQSEHDMLDKDPTPHILGTLTSTYGRREMKTYSLYVKVVLWPRAVNRVAGVLWLPKPDCADGNVAQAAYGCVAARLCLYHPGDGGM